MSKIYKNRDAAIEAVCEFKKKLEKLTDEYNLTVDGDYMSSIYYIVSYSDESGNIQHYYGY